MIKAKHLTKITDINNESVLSIAGALFDKIIVESVRDKDNEKKLYFIVN